MNRKTMVIHHFGVDDTYIAGAGTAVCRLFSKVYELLAPYRRQAGRRPGLWYIRGTRFEMGRGCLNFPVVCFLNLANIACNDFRRPAQLQHPPLLQVKRSMAQCAHRSDIVTDKQDSGAMLL